MYSTLMHINDLPQPYSTPTRHQRGLISSLYHYCVGNDKGKESKVWGYNSFLYERIMGEIGERRYKYLGIIEADLINEKEMKKIIESKKEGWN